MAYFYDTADDGYREFSRKDAALEAATNAAGFAGHQVEVRSTITGNVLAVARGDLPTKAQLALYPEIWA